MARKRKLNNGRDVFTLMIINGATKAYVSKDKKKEQSRKACRTYKGEN
jgi:hypothetical protein